MPILTDLKACRLFDSLDGEDLQLLAPLCDQGAAEKDDVLLREGEPAKFLYIVVNGRVALEMTLVRPDGSVTSPTTMMSIGPGEDFVWSSIVKPHVSTLSARAVERSSFIMLDGLSLREVLTQHKQIGYSVLVKVTELFAARLPIPGRLWFTSGAGLTSKGSRIVGAHQTADLIRLAGGLA